MREALSVGLLTVNKGVYVDHTNRIKTNAELAESKVLLASIEEDDTFVVVS